MEHIYSRRPPTLKGRLIRKIILKSTLGRAFYLNVPLVDPASTKYVYAQKVPGSEVK